MTAKRSENPDEQELDSNTGRDYDEISDDDSYSFSSESSEDSSTGESPPPPESINGDQIRQNARELLQSPSPDNGESGKKSIGTIPRLEEKKE